MTNNHDAASLYLHLLKQVLTRTVAPEKYRALEGLFKPYKTINKIIVGALQPVLRRNGLEIVRRFDTNPAKREDGSDWPPDAETMVGMKRLDNVQECIAAIVRDGVLGDVIEAGTWRGGCAIFMSAALAAFGDAARSVWVADSFEGLPKPDTEKYPQDAGDDHWTKSEYLGVSLEDVKANFQKYGMLDKRVRFLKGWFKDTLPVAPISQLSLVRLDGDMYGSTMDALTALYPKLSVGGYLIIDDYALEGCKAAVDDFRRQHGITEPIHRVDWTGIYWRRTATSAERDDALACEIRGAGAA